MWRNYWTVAVRALAKSRTYSIINIAGLAIGMAACMALLLYVRFEHSYDAWLPNADRTYQLQTHTQGGDVPPNDMQQAPYRLPWEMKKDFPQIEAAASTFVRSPIVKIAGEPSIVEDAWVADPTVFDVLQVPFAQGNRETALSQSGSVVLSQTEAARLFHGRPALGSLMDVSLAGKDYTMRVTAIMRDLPEATHLKMPMVIRLDRSMYADQAFIFANQENSDIVLGEHLQGLVDGLFGFDGEHFALGTTPEQYANRVVDLHREFLLGVVRE